MKTVNPTWPRTFNKLQRLNRTLFSGIVFDFDGVVVDSERHWVDVETPYLAAHIPGWTSAAYSRLVGRSLPEAHELLRTEYGFAVPAETYFADYERMAAFLYRDLIAPIEGLHDILALLQDRQAKVAIASSAKRSWIVSALQTHQLTRSFPIIASAHDPEVKRGKPAPDVYLQAVKLLDKSAANLIAIEDSETGVRAAKAAGLYCFGLRNGMNDEQDLSEADEITRGYSSAFIKTLSSLLR